MTVAIIAGTGIVHAIDFTLEPIEIPTEYGAIIVNKSVINGQTFLFLPRHGVGHSVPPHKINYRANIRGLAQAGVKRMLATYAVGSINPQLPPLSLSVIDDFLDFTQGRNATFFDGGSGGVQHVDMSQPYCPVLRSKLVTGGARYGLTMQDGGVYVATNGPRFETPAEIQMYAKLGGDVVGMTGAPEAALASEAGICFAGIALSINWAVGIQPGLTIASDGIAEIRTALLNVMVDVLSVGNDDDCVPPRLISGG